MLEAQRIESGDIVIAYTGYVGPRTETDVPTSISLTYEAAEYLANIPVRAFGTDAFSVDSLTDQTPVNSDSEATRTFPVHYPFLTRGIPTYEQLLNLERLIGKERMYFVGAPLNIKGGDGMLVRPVVLLY